MIFILSRFVDYTELSAVSILELKRNRAFTKAVSNMAIMDITDIEPLLMAVYELLQETAEFLPKLSQNGSGDDLSICLLQISSK